MTQKQGKTRKGGGVKKGDKKLINHTFVWLLIIPLLGFSVYQSITNFGLVNWDDKHYVKETSMVQGVTWEHVKQMFTQKVLRSYNPLVLLSFAIDFEMSKLSPHWMHAVNLIFHLLNAILLFACMKKMKFRTEISGLIAILFVVHPLSTEAVVWVAGRKDMLYAFFFLLSWLFYLRFTENNRRLNYFISITFFVFSLLSKVQAITLPFILIVSDYMLSGRISRKQILEKIPFLILTIIFGIVAVSGSSLVADKYSTMPTTIDKIVYSIMGIGLYVIKIFIPFNQSGIYSFPQYGGSEYWSLLITGVLITAGLILAVIKTYKKSRAVAGGILFFLISIFIVLHVVAFNSSLIYERFTYVAAIGLFISLMNLDQLFPSWEKVRTKIIWSTCIVLGVICYMRAQVWKDPESLWSDVIEKAPDEAVGWNNRGMVYLDDKQDEKALADFNECIRRKPKHPDAYNNRSIIYYNRKDYKRALEDNLRLLAIDSAHNEGYGNRASFFYTMQLFDSAEYYYLKATEINGRNASAFFYAGVSEFNKKNHKAGISYLKKAVEIVPNYADAFVFLGLGYARLNKIDSVLYFIKIAESLVANSTARQSAAKEYQIMGNDAFNAGDWEKARNYYNTALEINPNDADALYYLGGIYISRQDIAKAREYWKKALVINPEQKQAKEWLAKVGD
jgi:tetratricopeptide (TPR) repeat protein